MIAAVVIITIFLVIGAILVGLWVFACMRRRRRIDEGVEEYKEMPPPSSDTSGYYPPPSPQGQYDQYGQPPQPSPEGQYPPMAPMAPYRPPSPEASYGRRSRPASRPPSPGGGAPSIISGPPARSAYRHDPLQNRNVYRVHVNRSPNMYI